MSTNFLRRPPSLAMNPVAPVEREFGVPIPGDILPPSRWTQTALKKMPATGYLNWRELFHRDAPVVVDLGCGNGRYLIGSALYRPGHDHFGLDSLPVVIRYARRRGNQRGLSNLKFAVGCGLDLLYRYVAPASVAEIHCYHPQPYYDLELVHKRLITPEFLAYVHRSLQPGGTFVVQTDNPGYWRYMKTVLPVFFDFEERKTPWPDAPRGRTRREIIATRKGFLIFRGVGHAKRDLNEADALRLAQSLPEPVFDADRRLRELDLLDRG
jgi:tRNA (guanine-N7-)-methyltransferase